MKIRISSDFSKTPGPRYPREGLFSGQTFRTDILLPKVREAIEKQETLLVDLDGTFGYGTSFLEEAFGGLIREDKIPLAILKRHLRFKSDDEPFLLDEIDDYMNEAALQSGE